MGHDNLQQHSWFAFDTVNTLMVFSSDTTIVSKVTAVGKQLEQILSRFRYGSDIWKINTAGGSSVPVSAHTEYVLRAALKYSALSSGAFDVTVGSLEDLWDVKSSRPSIPRSEEIQRGLCCGSYRDILLRNHRVTVPAGMELDLGGIAKGYIADEMADLIRRQNIPSAMINLGGNVMVIGGRPDARPWRIGIQAPGRARGTFCAVLSGRDVSVVTSGLYERGFDRDGKRYHHILDTRTGYPVENDLASVTVAAPNSIDADALSTTCFCLGLEKSLLLLETLPNCEALFIQKDGRQIWTGAKNLYQKLQT